MNMVLKALGIFVIAAAGAGSVIYLDGHCPKKQEMLQKTINEATAKYIAGHPQALLEQIAKSENFGNTIKNFSSVSEEELNLHFKTYLENNPGVFENYIRDNADFIVTTLLANDEFKSAMAQAAPSNSAEETAQEAVEQSEPAESANQKYLDHWEEMRNSSAAPFVGPEDANITVVEFFDFACGHCKALAPIMGQLIKNNPDVKFVFNPLYFLSEHSNYAAKAAMVAAEKGKFVEVYEGIMTLPEMNKETIDQILADEGIDVEEAQTLMEEKKIRRGSQDIDALSQVLDINGVPMLIINGEPFYGRSLEDLQNKINSYK